MKAAELAGRLGGDGKPGPTGNYCARCPAHEDLVPSLSLKDGRYGGLVFHCFAGCPASLVKLKLLAIMAGGPRLPPGPVQTRPRKAVDTVAAAKWIREETLPGVDTIVEPYWRVARGITSPLPESLRFHRSLRHPSGTYHPAMVADVVNAAGEWVAIHRTWLRPDGLGKAGVTPDKMSLGPTKGGAVRLGEGGDTLVLGEGIETAASAAMLLGVPAVWATISSSNMKNIIIPAGSMTEIVIAADNDANGAGLAAAEVLRQRLLIEHRKVSIRQPKIEGQDFNDVLRAREWDCRMSEPDDDAQKPDEEVPPLDLDPVADLEAKARANQLEDVYTTPAAAAVMAAIKAANPARTCWPATG